MRGNRKPDPVRMAKRRVAKEFERAARASLARRDGFVTLRKSRPAVITRRASLGPIRMNRRQLPLSVPYTEFQATARRLAQIERGQLTEANGLVR